MNEEMKTGMLLSYQSVKEQVDTIKAELKRKGIEKDKGLSVLEAFIDDNIKWLNREQEAVEMNDREEGETMNKLIEERLMLADTVERVSGMTLKRILSLLVMGAEFKVQGKVSMEGITEKLAEELSRVSSKSAESTNEIADAFSGRQEDKL